MEYLLQVYLTVLGLLHLVDQIYMYCQQDKSEPEEADKNHFTFWAFCPQNIRWISIVNIEGKPLQQNCLLSWKFPINHDSFPSVVSCTILPSNIDISLSKSNYCGPDLWVNYVYNENVLTYR